MEEIIKKAIEGQWNFEHLDTDGLVPKLEFVRSEFRGTKYGIEVRALYKDADGKEYGSWVSFDSWVKHHQERTVLDYSFWQALGKACGWKNKFEIENGINSNGTVGRPKWLENAHIFHEINLTESWDKAVEWLATLIKSK